LTAITLYYDYQCPFAYRGVRLFTEIEQTRPKITIDWRFLSLEQINYDLREHKDTDPWYIWAQDLDYAPLRGSSRQRILAAFLASHAAAVQGTEAFTRFRLAVFSAYHDEERDISNPSTLLDIGRRVGLDLNAFQTHWRSTEARNRLRLDHEQGRSVGAFGVPTIVINGSEATYLRLTSYPTDPAERQSLFDHLVHTIVQRPYLQELKRASAQ
jgi:predicted DsbA family dithiol-disulfide isomerase